MIGRHEGRTNTILSHMDQDYQTIRDALSDKPAILQAILQSSKQQAFKDATSSLKQGDEIKPDLPNRLAQAEIIYQEKLNEQADYLLALYKKLPVDQKIELLIFAVEIGEMNDKARKLANQQMQTERTRAIATHQVKISHHNEIQATPSKSHQLLTHSQQTQASVSKQQTPTTKNSISTPADEQGLINQIGLGNPAAITVNFPFTVIPGLPALSKILEKIDKTTHFDLGITIKGIADWAPNPNGGHDMLYRFKYIGAGIMSSKFNVQIAPIALKLQESVDTDKWGGNASIFAKHRANNTGEKFSVNFNDNDGSISYAHEYSYQKPSNKIISTITAGHHFSRDSSPALLIPAEIIPTIDRIMKALPSKEEASIIFDRIDKVNPANQAYNVASSLIDTIDRGISSSQTTLTASIYLLKQKIAQSGLSAEAQADVLAHACKNCENVTQHGELPIIHIHEKLLPHQISAETSSLKN